jgi:hypothetical protein
MSYTQAVSQIEAFKNIWESGYFEGDPLDPMGPCLYGQLGYMSILHATYLACIKPYIHSDTSVLEIGAGRGAWTRTMLDAKQIAVLEAVPPEQNGFWDYVGRQPHVIYHEVSDFSCSPVPDNHFDYFWCFGVFCHIPNGGVETYMENVYRKLRSGAHGFMLHADFSIYNRTVQNPDLRDVRACRGRRYAPAKKLWELIRRLSPMQSNMALSIEGGENEIGWHDLPNSKATRMLEDIGYRIADANVGTIPRDPIIHFVKP